MDIKTIRSSKSKEQNLTVDIQARTQDKEARIKAISTGVVSLFFQTETEHDFIRAIGSDVPSSDTASLLWHTLSYLYDLERSREGFEEQKWRATCEELAQSASRGDGLSHSYYVELFSESIDRALHQLPQGHRQLATEIAREWEYATVEEREEQQRWNAENGDCIHGIDPDCCPAGCGDL